MPLVALEALVTAIMDDNVILQINDTGQEIAWPVNAFEDQIAVGESFTVQLKPTPAQKINNILTTAKTKNRQIGADLKNTQDQENIQKMLEALIN